ncbi:MAG: pol polyprotein, partial [Candidatus Saccharimonadales bacterium]
MGRPCRFLIDSGASANFVSKKWCEAQGAGVVALDKGVEVRLADGALSLATQYLENGEIHMGQYKDKISFVLLELTNADAILGLPWLKAIKPFIDWDTHRVMTKEGKTINVGEGVKQQNRRKTHDQEQWIHYAAFQQALKESEEDSTAGLVYKKKLVALLEQYKDLFPEDLPPGLPPQREFDHHIELKPGTQPIAKKQYRIPQAYLPEWKRQIEQQLAAGKIRESQSPWSSPVCFSEKKNGKLRMCLDFRGPNAVTVPNHTALPLQGQMFDATLGARWFSKLDLRSGFNQVRMHPDSIPVTAFNTPWGHFECTAMPFGLMNAPATFQSLMQHVLRERLYQGVVVFIDDFLIYTKTENEHLEMLEWVFAQLRKHQLYGAIDKCEFMREEVEILGHRLNKDGIKTQPAKIEAIKSWPTPTSVKDVRSFLGLANYYRKFVSGFSRIAGPLHKLVEKKNKWEWGTEQEKSFVALKEALSAAPTLIIPSIDKAFTLTTDASQFAIGAVLSQEKDGVQQPIAFLSHRMSSAERNYPTHEQELLAIVQSLKEWRYYLLGAKKPIVVHTDHRSLQYLSTQPELSKRQQRWMETLHEYRLSVKYKPGSHNVVADALSRRADHEASRVAWVPKSTQKPSQSAGSRVRPESSVQTPVAASVTAVSVVTAEAQVVPTSSSAVTAGTTSAAVAAVAAVAARSPVHLVNSLQLCEVSMVVADSLVSEIRSLTAADPDCRLMISDPESYG